MGALKKHQLRQASRADSDWRVNKVQTAFAGFIFVCNNSTMPDLNRRIFGLPATHQESVRSIRRGMPLFLYNYSTKLLHGVFEAASDGGYNIDPYAWDYIESSNSGRYSIPISKYPAQVRVFIRAERLPLEEEMFRPVLDRAEGLKFRLELTSRQVQQLLRLFGVPGFSKRGPAMDRHRGNAVPFQDSEAPSRFAFKLGVDSHSECSSRGRNACEDEWVDENSDENDVIREATMTNYRQMDSERLLSEKLSRIALNDLRVSGNGVYERESNGNGANDSVLLHAVHAESEEDRSLNRTNGNGHWKGASQKTARCSFREGPQEPSDNSSVLLRLLDNDPAVNSNSITWIQAEMNEPSTTDGHDDSTVPMIPSQFQSSFLANGEKMFLIPVQTFPCLPSETPCVVPEWNETKKLSRSRSSRKYVHSQDRHNKSRDVRLQRERLDIDDQDLNSSQQQMPQFSQVLVPIKGLLHDQGQIATLGIALAVPQTSIRMDDTEGGLELANGGPVLPEEFQQLLQSGHYRILLMPSVIPRFPPNPPPITDGFVQGLHFDILHFAKFTRPSADIQRYVEAAIDCVRKGVKMVWPEADVEVFGSFATGLCLQHSDVDLAVIDAPPLATLESLSIAQASASLIRELASVLQLYDWCESINALDTATVPVLKCRCRPFQAPTDCASSMPSIAIDITIGGMRDSDYVWSPLTRITDTGDHMANPKNHITRHTGGAAREYVLQKIQELPALAPLVLLLKSYLHHRNLSNVYLGGLGSFSLTLLLAFYLERVPFPVDVFSDSSSDMPVSPTLSLSTPLSCSSEFSDDSDAQSSRSGNGGSSSVHRCDPGTLSLGEHYVRRAADVIDLVLSRWSLRGSPYLGILLLGFLRTFGVQLDLSCEKIVLKGLDGEGGLFKREDRHVALWIDDPLRPGVNVGAGSFAMVHVQAAFKEMLEVLTKQQTVSSPLRCSESDCQDLATVGRLSHLSQLMEADAY